MSGCPYVAEELKTKALSRVITQYRETPLFRSYIELFLDQLEELNEVFCDLRGAFDVDDAEGDQLDKLGISVGWPRCHCAGKKKVYFGFICGTCGFVMSEKNTSMDSEDGFFDDHIDKRRTGDSVTLARHDMGLSTVINSKNKDAMGKPIATNMIKTIERLRMWDIRSHNEPAQKNLRFAFGELVRMKDKLGLPESVVEKAAYLYRKALEKRLTRGRTISSIIAAALYMACRDAQTLRTINDFVSTTNIRKKQLTKCYRLLITELGMVLPAIDPVRCVSRIANNLNISEKTKRIAIEILKKAYQEKISIHQSIINQKKYYKFRWLYLFYSCHDI